MEFWLPFWKWTLIVGVGLFAGLTVAVIIGGAFDIRSLFRSLREQHEHGGPDEAGGDHGEPSEPRETQIADGARDHWNT